MTISVIMIIAVIVLFCAALGGWVCGRPIPATETRAPQGIPQDECIIDACSEPVAEYSTFCEDHGNGGVTLSDPYVIVLSGLLPDGSSLVVHFKTCVPKGAQLQSLDAWHEADYKASQGELVTED